MRRSRPTITKKATSKKQDEDSSTSPKVYLAGEHGSPLSSITGRPVSYENIKKAFSKSHLYEDPDFPPGPSSLGHIEGDSAANSGSASKSPYKWLRPKELCKLNKIPTMEFALAQDSLSSTKLCSEYDVSQGRLGDCWYLAALGDLTRRPEKLKFIIPEDNFHGFEEGKYCGAFHFRFYHMFECKWVDVVVDDRLPCITEDGVTRIAFTNISAKYLSPVAEFWPPLIEKAYAKFVGNYSKIEGGYVGQGLEDFTGGFSEIIYFEYLDTLNVPSSTPKPNPSKYEKLKEKIQGIVANGYFMGLLTYSLDDAAKYGALHGYTDYTDILEDDGSVKQKRKGYKTSGGKKVITDSKNIGLGLCPEHAYSALDAVEVKTKDGKQTRLLIKMLNPHATHEWTGPYSDDDNEGWSLLQEDLRKKNKAGSKNIDEGVFWIELSDVLKYICGLEVCHFGLADGIKLTYLQGEWPASLQKQGIEVVFKEGGDDLKLVNMADLQYFKAYKFEAKQGRTSLTRPTGTKNKCVVAFTLVLGGYHSMLKPFAEFNYYLFKVSETDLARPLEELYRTHTPLDVGIGNIEGREVSKWMTVDPGTYIIVPVIGTKTKNAANAIESVTPEEFVGKSVNFTVRLFTENEAALEEVQQVSQDPHSSGAGKRGRKRKHK